MSILCWFLGHNYKYRPFKNPFKERALDPSSALCWRCTRCNVQWWARHLGYGLWPKLKLWGRWLLSA
jgi:uncharacterized membrane protein